MNYLFYFGHPAQYLFLRQTIKQLSVSNKNNVIIVIKSKDVLEELLKQDNFDFLNIQPYERSKYKFAILISLINRLIKLLKIVIKTKSNVLVGTDATISIVGFLCNKLRITIVEDDYQVIKNLAMITYPFTNYILCPNICNVGKWGNKKIGYDGYMKLAYLHPEVFTPDKNIILNYGVNKNFAIIRLSKLGAHHDFGINGISDTLLIDLIEILEKRNIKVLISSERKIPHEYEKYILKLNPTHLHHFLYFSELLICDSQSMTVEASILGVPSIRISDFINKISVLNELEFRYGLTIGIKPSDNKKIIDTLLILLKKENLKIDYLLLRNKMLQEKINVSNFLTWILENPNERLKEILVNPKLQLNFISRTF
jgi:hypothetical protein